MDDGSIDNTKQIVSGYIKQKIIDVKYFYEENKGKMYALNRLVEMSTGDYIIECDSDDYFDIAALKTVEDTIQKYPDMENIYAIAFLKYDQEGNNMGNDFPEDNYISTMFDLYFKEKITGEKEANITHYKVGNKIRKTIEEIGGTMPEKLPTPSKSLKELEKERKNNLLNANKIH